MNDTIQARLKLFRKEMDNENIDYYLVVTDDFHSSEYVGDYFKCREYLSGFDGSAGTLLIMKNKAILWTDGRYFIQAKEQLEGTGIELYKQGVDGVPSIYKYLRDNFAKGQTIGFDARTISNCIYEKLEESLEGKNAKFVVDKDLVDRIWKDRPDFPNSPIWILDVKYSGKNIIDKISIFRNELEKNKCDASLIASLDDVAWLYNIRGNDIEYTPVVLAYTLIDKKCCTLYISDLSLDSNSRQYLNNNNIVIKDYFQIYEDVKNISDGTNILIDSNSVNYALMRLIPHNVHKVIRSNPTTLLKAVKNPTEMNNERIAHIKDGVALTKLLFYIKSKMKSEIEAGKLTELDISRKLLELRKEDKDFIEESFASIIATGAHGAIVHYEPTDKTNMAIQIDTFLLMDTGGHYFQGTTDVTRTVAIGNVSSTLKKHYTAVLKGNLNLANAYFRSDCSGENLDYLAREPLWRIGLDYRHGTGHGVGYIMNVHEGPNSIRTRSANSKMGIKLQEGMITSNEPGVYIEGSHGIRLENLVLCVNDIKNEYGQFLKFETLTKVPFDLDAIDENMLTDNEKMLLNEYHKNVYLEISPYLDGEEKAWLKDVTRPL